MIDKTVHGFDYHYLHNPQAGFTVTYGDKAFRIHDDGKGWLHIILQEKGSRKKIGLDRLRETTFEYGSEEDWKINGWWQIYPDYELFRGFAEAERACV